MKKRKEWNKEKEEKKKNYRLISKISDRDMYSIPASKKYQVVPIILFYIESKFSTHSQVLTYVVYQNPSVWHSFCSLKERNFISTPSISQTLTSPFVVLIPSVQQTYIDPLQPCSPTTVPQPLCRNHIATYGALITW